MLTKNAAAIDVAIFTWCELMAKKEKSPADELRDMADDLTWGDSADDTPREQCPCCDYVTLSERGDWEICPICFWEDDWTNVDNLDRESGVNGLTLREARSNFKEFGACELRALPSVLPVSQRKKYHHQPR